MRFSFPVFDARWYSRYCYRMANTVYFLYVYFRFSSQLAVFRSSFFDIHGAVSLLSLLILSGKYTEHKFTIKRHPGGPRIWFFLTIYSVIFSVVKRNFYRRINTNRGAVWTLTTTKLETEWERGGEKAGIIFKSYENCSMGWKKCMIECRQISEYVCMYFICRICRFVMESRVRAIWYENGEIIVNKSAQVWEMLESQRLWRIVKENQSEKVTK